MGGSQQSKQASIKNEEKDEVNNLNMHLENQKKGPKLVEKETKARAGFCILILYSDILFYKSFASRSYFVFFWIF